MKINTKFTKSSLVFDHYQRAFMELLGKYNVSVFNYSAEDLGVDFNHA